MLRNCFADPSFFLMQKYITLAFLNTIVIQIDL